MADVNETNPEIEDVFASEDEELDIIRKQIKEITDMLGILNPRNLAGLSSSALIAITRANYFGDGSDGDVVISSNVSLSSDMFYETLTIDSGYTLNTNGYRVFCKGDLKNNGSISTSGNNGASGGAGGNGTSPAGAAGTGSSGGAAAHGQGSLPSVEGGIDGGEGGYLDGTQTGTAGDDATDVAKSLGAGGSSGASGGGSGLVDWSGGAGEGNYAGGTGGGAGDQTGTVYNIPRSYSSAYILIDGQPTVASLTGSGASGAGGGGGAGGASYSDGIMYAGGGGGGAGAGSPGGFIELFAFKLNNAGIISSNGGNGGDGGNGGNGVNSNSTLGAAGGGGGGGGASGGAGGVIILIYGTKTGSGTTTVNGGDAGAAGVHGTTAIAGSPNRADISASGGAGAAGANGTIIEVALG